MVAETQTREDLISNLYRVKQQIQNILSVQTRQIELASSFREQQTKITPISVVTKKEKIKICVVAFYIAQLLVSVISCFERLSSGIVLTILWALLGLFIYKIRNKQSAIAKFIRHYFIFVIGIGGIIAILSIVFSSEASLFERVSVLVCNILAAILVKVAIKKKNQKISEENIQIEENNIQIANYNNDIQNEHDETVRQLQYLKEELLNDNAFWFPKDYYSLEAVTFFISAIENFKADSMKEAVLLLDDTQYKNEMLNSQRAIVAMSQQQLINQQEMIKQLKFANVLNVANLALSVSTLGAINQNTAAVNANSYAVNSAASQTTSAMNNAANAANQAAQASNRAANTANKIWKNL